MQTLQTVFDLVGGRPLPIEDRGPSRRWSLVVLSLLASVVFAGLYGLAAGSTDVALAITDLLKVPAVMLLSVLAAIPAGLLVWQIAGARFRCADLVIGVANGNLVASMTLAAFAPLVALYYHSTGTWGGVLAMVAHAAALAVGLYIAVKSIWNRLPADVRFVHVVPPLAVMLIVHMMAMVQLVSVMSPILPEVTPFDGGVDVLLGS